MNFMNHSPYRPRLQSLPLNYQRNLEQAVNLLRQAGCRAVFLFGSLASGEIRPNSDIDLAIRGCPPGDFFRLLGQLMLTLDYPVDLINLDNSDPFTRYLEKEGDLLQIG